MFYVYIIYSEEKDVYYKGFTADLHRCVLQHNSGKSDYTSAGGIWKLVYSQVYETKKEALIEEKRLKKLNRASVEN